MLTAPAKPAFGSPCNGCGVCCTAELCRVGKALFGDVPAPCPGMRWRDGRFACVAVEMADESQNSAFLRLVMGIGVGCDADDPETDVGVLEKP